MWAGNVAREQKAPRNVLYNISLKEETGETSK